MVHRLSWLIAVILCLGIGGLVAAQEASGPSRPNILIAIADDWSYGHASAYGCAWVDTPNFDRVAREGLLFHRAFTPNAKCAPSRATILTGRYSWQLEEAGNHMALFPPKFGSFMERLAAAGYFAGYTGKGWGPGIANDDSGKPRAITGKAYQKRTAKPPTSGISNRDYAANFEDFLADVPEGQPWVFWFGTTEPHRGYEFQSGVRAGKRLTDIDHVPDYWPDTEVVRHDMLDYAVEVEHYDHHLGRILAAIEDAGQLENTLIVCTSDHGMPFPRVKGQAYMHSNRVPLAIRWPAGIRGGGREILDFVDFADLAPTFLEVAGVTDPGPIMQPLAGRSLTRLFAADQGGHVDPTRDHVLVGKERHDVGRPHDWGYPIRGICTEQWLLLHNFEPDRWPAGNPETGYLNCDGSPTKSLILDLRRSAQDTRWWKLCFGKRPEFELYNLTVDPDCVNNVAYQPQYLPVREELEKQMVAELKSQGDPRMFGRGDVFDGYPYSSPATRGFYERFMRGEEGLRAGWVNGSDFEPEPIEDSPEIPE
ncbi:MAG: heparan N-sulfatase [Pirellulaceae bacterium]|nr:MAG: heparan N-sulfatase [Pirellulaceae bacterium]